MSNHALGAIPNFLGEKDYKELETQCIALFVAVALEKDPAKRLVLRTRRDELRLALLLRDSAAANMAWLHSRVLKEARVSFNWL